MVIRSGIDSAGDALEAPQIDLTSEAQEFGLFEESRQDLGGEYFWLFDDEGAAVGHPVDDGG